MAPLRAALASGNPHKARELERLLPGWEIEPIDADYPPETGDTFYENALGKARFGRTVAPADAWVIGEDSGIEVEALGGGPGVQSARWAAGEEAGRMLEAMRGQANRRARYVSELVAIDAESREYRGTGTLSGSIAETAEGTGGFGFDPVFVPDGEHETVGVLGDDWKQGSSHRARAARALLEALGAAPNPVPGTCR